MVNKLEENFMKNIKCIYCNKNESDGITLSESDIIPESLTNKKIINNNVCELDHNQKFGETFESDVINQMEYIRNMLGIKSKNGKFPTYSAKYIIDQSEYKFKKKQMYLQNLGQRIFSSENEYSKTLLGPTEIIKNIQQSKHPNSTLDEINLNEKEILIKTEINCNVFFCSSMKRLAAKIGYEWHCKNHNINEVHQEYNDIINFICTNNSPNKVVNVVKCPDIYELLDKNCSLGSHTLIEYNYEGNFYVLLYFFGLVIYKIKVSNHVLYKTGLRYEEVKIDGSIKQEKFSSLTSNEVNDTNINEILKSLSLPSLPSRVYYVNLNVDNIQSPDNKELHLSNLFLNNLSSIFNKEIETITNPTDIEEMLTSRIRKLIKSYNPYNILVYKRLLTEIKDIEDDKILQKVTSPIGVLNLYTIYILGKNYTYDDVKSRGIIKVLKKIHKEICHNFFPENTDLSPEVTNTLREILITDNNFTEYFNQGKKIIN